MPRTGLYVISFTGMKRTHTIIASSFAACFTACIHLMPLSPAAAETGSRFAAGFARAEITPETGTPLSGYYIRRVSDGVLDPLYARCLALSDGKSRALVYSVDNVHLVDAASAEIRSEISRRTGVPFEAVFLACTHTHTGPVSHVPQKGVPHWETVKAEDVPYIKRSNALIAARCAEAGVEALSDLSPAEILAGRGEAKGISFVRRFLMKDGTVRTNPGVNNPDIARALGEPDEQLQLVRFARKGKKEIALVNFQCHPDTIGGTKFSADWPGLSCTYLEGAMRGNVDAIFINGAQGDTNHVRVKVDPGETAPHRYEMAHHMARVVAGAALSAWGTCAPVEAGALSARNVKVKVRPNRGTAADAELARRHVLLHESGRDAEIPGKGMEHTANVAAAYRILEVEEMPEEPELSISVVTVGKSLAICGFPGEPFTWMGTELKRRSPFAVTIPACCVNGMRDYFPVESAYTKGGYENATSRYAAGTAESLVEAMLKELSR